MYRFVTMLAVCLAGGGGPCAQAGGVKLDRFGGALAVRGTKTGRWHIQKVAGRHRFVTPAGHGFYALGVNHIPSAADPAARYCDAIAVQAGPTQGPSAGQGPDESAFDRRYWRRLHELTGKPVFVCDHAVSFATPAHPRTLWHRMESEADAARHYDGYLRKVAAEPYILGYQRCQYRGRYDPLRALMKQGLVDPDGRPYAKLVGQVRATNSAVLRGVYNLGKNHKSCRTGDTPCDSLSL